MKTAACWAVCLLWISEAVVQCPQGSCEGGNDESSLIQISKVLVEGGARSHETAGPQDEAAGEDTQQPDVTPEEVAAKKAEVLKMMDKIMQSGENLDEMMRNGEELAEAAKAFTKVARRKPKRIQYVGVYQRDADHEDPDLVASVGDPDDNVEKLAKKLNGKVVGDKTMVLAQKDSDESFVLHGLKEGGAFGDGGFLLLKVNLGPKEEKKDKKYAKAITARVCATLEPTGEATASTQETLTDALADCEAMYEAI